MDFDESPFSGNIIVVLAVAAVSLAILLYFLPIIHALSLSLRPSVQLIPHVLLLFAAN